MSDLFRPLDQLSDESKSICSSLFLWCAPQGKEKEEGVCVTHYSHDPEKVSHSPNDYHSRPLGTLWSKGPGTKNAHGRGPINICWVNEKECLMSYSVSSVFRLPSLWTAQVALVVKNLSANAGEARDTGSSPGSGRSPGGGNGNPLYYSCLGNPMNREEPGGLQSIALQWVRQDWALAHTHKHWTRG